METATVPGPAVGEFVPPRSCRLFAFLRHCDGLAMLPPVTRDLEATR